MRKVRWRELFRGDDMYDEKKFWKIAHKTIKAGASKQAFITKMLKYKNMVPHVPSSTQKNSFMPFVLGKAYDAWHDGTEFGAWRPYR
jgi:hypothetical protein